MERGKQLLLGLLGSGLGLFILALTVLSFPLNIIVLMRWYSLEWWTALIAVTVMSVVPAIGQLAYIVFTFFGVYYLYQADFDWKIASKSPTKTFNVSELSSSQFAEYARTVLRPQIRDYCIESSKQKFGYQGMVPEAVPVYCGCYAKVMFEQVSQKDWVENASLKTAPPAFLEKFSRAVQAECLPMK